MKLDRCHSTRILRFSNLRSDARGRLQLQTLAERQQCFDLLLLRAAMVLTEVDAVVRKVIHARADGSQALYFGHSDGHQGSILSPRVERGTQTANQGSIFSPGTKGDKRNIRATSYQDPQLP